MIVKCLMLPYIVKEIYVIGNTVDETSLRSIVSAIGFFLLESSKEGLGNGIVQRITRR